MTDTNTLYAQELWDQGYENLKFEKAPRTDIVAQWLLSSLPATAPTPTMQTPSCLEIGCFPGRYLALMGDLGFELNGVDLTPRTDTEMAAWLLNCGYSTGQLVRGDFFTWEPHRTFDLVYSNGFIEHFEDWPKALRRHAELVAPGGTLLVAVPNFAGSLQKFLHQKLDDRNFGRHFIPSMDPSLWVKELGPDFQIEWQGYFGRFHFWIGEQERTLSQKLAFWTVRALIPALSRLLPKSHPSFAPYCGLVARKKERPSP